MTARFVTAQDRKQPVIPAPGNYFTRLKKQAIYGTDRFANYNEDWQVVNWCEEWRTENRWQRYQRIGLHPLEAFNAIAWIISFTCFAVGLCVMVQIN